MAKTKIALDLDLGFASLPVPDKIVIPIGAGKIGPFSYKQHETDPMTAEKISFQPGGQDRLKINVRVTGRVAVSNFSDLRLGGFKVEVTSGLAVQNLTLRFTAPQITRSDMPNVPPPFDNLIKQLLNKFLLQILAEALEINLKTPMEKALAQINRPIIFDVPLGKNNFKYEFKPNIESVEPQVTVSPAGLRLNFAIGLAPTIGLLQSSIMRAVLPVSRARRRVQRPRRKTA
jgi:hypothetical protein